MDCADRLSSELSCADRLGALLQEATGDSESDDLATAAADGSLSAFDADDGDAESCTPGEDGAELDVGRRLVSWECWVMEAASMVVAGGEAASAPLSTEDAAAGDAESDRLFWEACIAHGY